MFEWDEAKRLKNLEKHHLDFRDVRMLFDGRPVVTISSHMNNEARFVSVARIEERFYTVVWTWRSGRRRIISFRSARDGEKRTYRKIHG